MTILQNILQQCINNYLLCYSKYQDQICICICACSDLQEWMRSVPGIRVMLLILMLSWMFWSLMNWISSFRSFSLGVASGDPADCHVAFLMVISPSSPESGGDSCFSPVTLSLLMVSCRHFMLQISSLNAESSWRMDISTGGRRRYNYQKQLM